MTVWQVGLHVSWGIQRRLGRVNTNLFQHHVVSVDSSWPVPFSEKDCIFRLLIFFFLFFFIAGQQWYSDVVQNIHVGDYLPEVKSEQNVFFSGVICFEIKCC